MKLTIRELKNTIRESMNPDLDFLDVWHQSLMKLGTGLDFSDPDDRAIYRGLVKRSMKGLKASGIRRMVQKLGVKPASNARDSLTRAIADAYINGLKLLP